MPIYEYTCEACNHNWEELQKITDEKIKICPKCGEEKAKRLISSGTSFILNGSGWFNKGGY